MRLLQKLKFVCRDLIYPGLDLHTRNRATLSRFWKVGSRDVLDAGSGNGYQSWLAYKSGARVLGLTFAADQVEKSFQYLVSYKGADADRLCFKQRNLYSLDNEAQSFDEIICYETLEHIRDDRFVLREFHRLLRFGGVLHLCCPNSAHPRHQRELLDEQERGGHVRAGYTENDYKWLLSQTGFEIEQVIGIGSRRLYIADKLLRGIRNRWGDLFALPLLPFALPLVWLDPLNPPMPFSIYARAVKKDSPRQGLR